VRALEEILALIFWVALVPFALIRRLGRAGRRESASRPVVWDIERRTLTNPSPMPDEKRAPFARVGAAWLGVRRAIHARRAP
jgi:hypothetical protein